MSYLILSNISVTNGTKIVDIHSNESLSNILENDELQLKGELPVSIQSVDNDARTITLKEDWDEANHANVKAQVRATANNFRDAATALKAVQSASTQAIQTWSNLSQTVTTVTIQIPGHESIQIDSIPKIISEATAAGTTLLDNAQAALDLMGPAPALAQQVADDKLLVDGYKATALQAVTDSTANKNASFQHKVDAETALNAVRAVFDDFDDRYLGAKATDPTLDNDGDPLQEGQIYFNTTEDTLKLWTGLTWESPEQSASASASSALSYKNQANTILGQVQTLRNEAEQFKDDAEAFSETALPSQTNNKNKTLVTNGESASWQFPNSINRYETNSFLLEAGDYVLVSSLDVDSVINVSMPPLQGREPFVLKNSASSLGLVRLQTSTRSLTVIAPNGFIFEPTNDITLEPGEQLSLLINETDTNKGELL